MGSLQCQEAETPASGLGGCTQRDGEAHIPQRPRLWAKIAVLWESGRSILAGSLEEVRFRGLYLESRGSKQFVPWTLGNLDSDQGLWGRSYLELRLGDRWEGLVEASVHSELCRPGAGKGWTSALPHTVLALGLAVQAHGIAGAPVSLK